MGRLIRILLIVVVLAAAGLGGYAWIQDRDGVPRPQGPGHDVGAYEFAGENAVFSDGFETGGTTRWSVSLGQ